MSNTNALVAEVLKALVARNASKRAKGILTPVEAPEQEAPSQENEISDEDVAALLEMGGEGEDEDAAEA